jgi:hypothetical protein
MYLFVFFNLCGVPQAPVAGSSQRIPALICTHLMQAHHRYRVDPHIHRGAAPLLNSAILSFQVEHEIRAKQ